MTLDPTFRFSLAPSMGEFGADEWNRLKGTSRAESRTAYNPFVSHAFLTALEDSGAVGGRSGWTPAHMRLENGDGRLAGAAPLYMKAHSQGEYVFDHGWAEAFGRAGGRYYPKLQCAVPFSPVPGPRLLTNGSGSGVQAALAAGLKAACGQLEASSAHVTFADDSDMAALTDAGFLHRTDQQFHFLNGGYANYSEFLGSLASRKRKALRKEREAALSGGISIDWLTGKDLTESAWDAFFEFYLDTGNRKWGRPYLNRTFFSLIGERMAGDILLVVAKKNGKPIAGALNLIGGERLYGRYWGATEDHPFLHFELCYHQAIDFALEKGLKVVEAGAQGEHKLARGYLPVTTHSAHYIVHPGLRRAVADYLEQEKRQVAEAGEILTALGPFRRGEAL